MGSLGACSHAGWHMAVAVIMSLSVLSFEHKLPYSRINLAFLSIQLKVLCQPQMSLADGDRGMNQWTDSFLPSNASSPTSSYVCQETREANEEPAEILALGSNGSFVLFCFLLFDMGCSYVAQAGLKLGIPPTFAPNAGITGMSHHTQPQWLILTRTGSL
jgi:hypothetical protein